MNPSFVELSLSLKPSYVPKSLTNLLLDLSKIDNEADKLLVLSDYICKHQEELSKVEASKHELPQCRLLLLEAIETLKKEYMNIKKNMESHQSDPQPDHHLVECLGTKRKNNEQEQRKIWGIRYSPDQEEYCNPNYVKKQKTLVLDNFQPPNLKAIQPCKELPFPYKESSSNSIGSSSTGKEMLQDIAMYDHQCSSRNQGFLHLNTDDHDHIQTLNHQPRLLTQPIWKNNRRCWSSELHARFVEALNVLGGIEAATPKQIRDLMQVEGLTIDQVKSHLQVILKLNLIMHAYEENTPICHIKY
ncbi:hypothetical protein PTKIN_Ptkin12aG0027800 [Pterospermum kingtungense]